MAEPVRLFVGGIPADISIEDISARFAPFGAVAGLERVPVKLHQSPLGTDPKDCRGFAYVDLVPASDSSVSKCCTAYNGAKWKGGRLRVEVARELYLFRLQKEWIEEEAAQASSGPVSETLEPKAESQPFATGMRERKLEPMRLAWGLASKTFRTMPAAGGPGTGKHKRSFQYRQPLSLEEIWSQATCVPLVAAQKDDVKAESEAPATASRLQDVGADIRAESRTTLPTSPADTQVGMSRTVPEVSRPGKEKVHEPAKEDVEDGEAVEEGMMDMSGGREGTVDERMDDAQAGAPLADAEEENGEAAVAAERKRQHAILGTMFPEEGFKALPVAKPSAAFQPTPRYDPGEQEVQWTEEEERGPEQERSEVEEVVEEVVEKVVKVAVKKVVKELSAWDKLFALAAGGSGRKEEEEEDDEEEEEGEGEGEEEEEGEEEQVEEEKVEEEKVEEETMEEKLEVEEDKVEAEEEKGEEGKEVGKEEAEEENMEEGREVEKEEAEDVGGREGTGGDEMLEAEGGGGVDVKIDGGGVQGETQWKKRKWKGAEKKRSRMKEGTDSGGEADTGAKAAQGSGEAHVGPQASGESRGEEKQGGGEWLEAAKWRALVNPSSQPEFRMGELFGGIGGIEEPVAVSTVMSFARESDYEEAVAPRAVAEAPRIREEVVVVKEEGTEVGGVCLFMRSPNAEKEWLASKGRLKEDYKKKQRAAMRKGGIRVKGGVSGGTL